MSQWADLTLGDVLTLQRGFDLPQRVREPGPYPVVSSAGVTGHHNEFKVEPPGVVIGRYGSLGSVHWVTEPFWPLNTSLWVKDFKGNDERFVSYLLETVTVDGSAASAVPGVNRNYLHKVAVRLPALDDQRRIAVVLSAFDRLIEINERRIEVLEDLIRSLYREWFVRRRFPGHRSASGSTSDQLPPGWTMCRLGDIAKLRYGKSLPEKRRLPGVISVVSSAGIIDTHNQALVEGPGIVIGRKGNVGSVWWVDGPFFPIDTTYYVESSIPLGYLYWLLRELDFVDSHAAIPGLNREQAVGVPIPLPPMGLVEEFAGVHDMLFQAVAIARRAIARLIVIRDLLLPRLVTGDLEISDIDLGTLASVEAE